MNYTPWTVRLKNIYAEGELDEVSTTEDFSVVQDRLFESDFDKEMKRIEGKRDESDD